MIAPDTFAERFTRVSARTNTRQRLNEAAPAVLAKKASARDDQLGVAAETLKVSDPALIEPLTVEVATSTVRAGPGPALLRFNKKGHLRLALILNYAVSCNSYLTRGWGQVGHGSIMVF